MTKKVIAGCLAVAVLGGLAYYSGYLYYGPKEAEIPLLDSKEREIVQVKPSAELKNTDSIPQHDIQTTEAAKTADAFDLEEKLETAGIPENGSSMEEEVNYYLVEEYGRVNIYLADRETIYEYTGIPIDSLPEELQMEICTGKAIANEQELYDFLENYSS